MSKVSITRSKLDALAVAVSAKSGEELPLTIDEMREAVNGISGGTAAISVVDTTDSHGGTIREITALDISDTTAVASDVATGKYFYTAQGIKTQGTASGGGGATQHVIHFEFSDSTETDIDVYYDDSYIGTMITAYTPAAYGAKTVTLAQLDGVTWYEPTPIPLNTQLIDFSAVTNDVIINAQGQEEAAQWYAASDYTVIDRTMTFSYTGVYWGSIGIYDSNYNVVGVIEMMYDATQRQDNQNLCDGVLDSTKLPINSAYVRISTMANPTSTSLSLIRTA